MGQDVYHATDFDILPISPKASVTNPPHPVEAHLLALVKSHLKSGYFLFSYTWDLTRRMQAQWESREKDQGKAMWEVVSCSFACFNPLRLTFPGRRSVLLEQVNSSRVVPVRRDSDTPSRFLQSRLIDQTSNTRSDVGLPVDRSCLLLRHAH
jgi:hypothetical protein